MDVLGSVVAEGARRWHHGLRSTFGRMPQCGSVGLRAKKSRWDNSGAGPH